MFGHIAGHQHRSRWVIPSFLFAVALAWSLAVTSDRMGGHTWGNLGQGTAITLGLFLLPIGLTFAFARRRRRGHKEDAEGAGAEVTEGQPPAPEERPTYGEIFGETQPGPDEGSPAPAPEDDDWQAESSEGPEMEAEGQPAAEETPTAEEGPTPEEMPTEEAAPTHEEELPTFSTDPDGAAEVEAIQADLETQESLRRLREEFAARAAEAELRIKQREAELHEAESASTSQP
jgi:hypothetical protein